MLYLYTENFFWLARFKNQLKNFLGKGSRGPQAVVNSLRRGLKEIGQPFVIDAHVSGTLDLAAVFSGVDTLKWAIEQKQKGRIKKIIAGPNITITPLEQGGILKVPEINKIVVPSAWVRDFYLSLAPELEPKIYVWVAGVDLPILTEAKKEFDFLILNKIHKDGKLFQQIKDFLQKANYKVRVLFYGNFKQPQYFASLKNTKYLIYLSESESQGISMFEAWAANVPTLVWERGYMQYAQYQWQGNTASPYLSNEAGLRFKDFEDFKAKLSSFLSSSFSARHYVEQNFTQKKSAEKFLQVSNA